MTRNLTLAITAAVALIILPTIAPAQSQQDPASVGAKRHQAKKHQAKKYAARRAPVGTKIACPKGGCREIPANCIVTKEMTRDDLPTGYDLIQCP